MSSLKNKNVLVSMKGQSYKGKVIVLIDDMAKVYVSDLRKKFDINIKYLKVIEDDISESGPKDDYNNFSEKFTQDTDSSLDFVTICDPSKKLNESWVSNSLEFKDDNIDVYDHNLINVAEDKHQTERLENRSIYINKSEKNDEMIRPCLNISEDLESIIEKSNKENNNGNEYYFKKEYKNALDCYHRAIEIYPQNANALYNIGNIHMDTGNLQQAIDYYKKSLVFNPNDSYSYLNLGDIFNYYRDFEEAIECYTLSINLNPNVPESYNNLGTVYDVNECYDVAVECYRIAIDLDPHNEVIRANLESAEDKLKNKVKIVDNLRGVNQLCH